MQGILRSCRAMGTMWTALRLLLSMLPMLLLTVNVPRAEAALVINTWPFTAATDAAFQVLDSPTSSSLAKSTVVDAVVEGCSTCEDQQCDFTVGFGGSPDSCGETTLDAMIMDGDTQEMGAVAYLRRVKHAIRVAKAVMDHSAHSILAGNGATEFAKMMGFQEETLSTPLSKKMFLDWQADACQPNYFRLVVGQQTSCPPYVPLSENQRAQEIAEHTAHQLISRDNHDTIGMVALDAQGRIAAGTSSNGANHKIAGRVGDAAIPGAGAYAESHVGGAAATGDGDVMMRFLPSFHAVQDMKSGIHPKQACERALLRIARKTPDFMGAMVCVNAQGEFGGAGYGWDFAFSIRTSGMDHTEVVQVAPVDRTRGCHEQPWRCHPRADVF